MRNSRLTVNTYLQKWTFPQVSRGASVNQQPPLSSGGDVTCAARDVTYQTSAAGSQWRPVMVSARPARAQIITLQHCSPAAETWVPFRHHCHWGAHLLRGAWQLLWCQLSPRLNPLLWI